MTTRQHPLHFPPLGADEGRLLVERLSRAIRTSELFFDGLQSNDYVEGVSGFRIDETGIDAPGLSITIDDIESSNWDGTSPADLSSGPDSGATAGYYLDNSAGAIQVQTLYAEGGTIRDLTAVDLDLQGDLNSSNWDGADPANLASFDGTATAGYYLDYSAGAAQFMGSVFVGGSVILDGSGVIRTADSGENHIELSNDPALRAQISFHHTSNSTDGSITQAASKLTIASANNGVGIRPSIDIDATNGYVRLNNDKGSQLEAGANIQGGANDGVLIREGLWFNYQTDPNGVIMAYISDPDTGPYHVGTNQWGWKTGGSQAAYFDTDQTLRLQNDLRFDGTSNVFLINTDGENVMTVNQDGVGFEDAATHLPNENWVEPAGMTSFTTGAWTAVTGSQITLWTHGGTNRTVEVYASATGRFRETGAVAYEVRLRVQISLDNGATWSSPSSFAQGYVGTATGGGGYRENMSSQLRVTGTATSNILARVQYYVASSPDGLDHVTLYGQADMVF